MASVRLRSFIFGGSTLVTIMVEVGLDLLVELVQPKGQLISKCLFGVFNFLQKTNENKSHSSKIEFIRSFFGGNVSLKKSFRFCLTFTTDTVSKKNQMKTHGIVVKTNSFVRFLEEFMA